MNFKEWWNTPKNYPTARSACKAAWDACKEHDAQIAEGVNICCSDCGEESRVIIADAIRNQEE